LKRKKARAFAPFSLYTLGLSPPNRLQQGSGDKLFISSKIGYRDVSRTSFLSLRVGAPAGFFLTPFSLPSGCLRELLSHRARDLSIRLFIQRFITKTIQSGYFDDWVSQSVGPPASGAALLLADVVPTTAAALVSTELFFPLFDNA